MKVDRVYSECETIIYPSQLPFWHCCEGNTINMSTIEWCRNHVLGYWGYWFDRQFCYDQQDLTNQTAYIGFTNSIDLFLFSMSAPNIYTDFSDLKDHHGGYC